MNNIQYDEIERWEIRYPILLNNEEYYKETYPIRIRSNTSKVIEFDINRTLYRYLKDNFSIKDLYIPALVCGLILITKNDNFIFCNFDCKCSTCCCYYEKCTYCTIKKLKGE